jgi:hypothetical protein
LSCTPYFAVDLHPCKFELLERVWDVAAHDIGKAALGPRPMFALGTAPRVRTPTQCA